MQMGRATRMARCLLEDRWWVFTDLTDLTFDGNEMMLDLFTSGEAIETFRGWSALVKERYLVTPRRRRVSRRGLRS